jgi:hypothetical protein
MEDWVRNAKVGDHVVCVADSCIILHDRGLPRFRKGMVLTISMIELDDMRGLFPQAEVFFYFDETGPFHNGHWRGFRPVRPVSIEVFTKLLNTAPAEVLEEA